jgi:hypothetical protein
VANGRIKIMFQDGSYYEGSYSNHRRHGLGTCWYPNGEFYEGQWSSDKRVGRGKMKFLNGAQYKGQFIGDQADGNGQYEDAGSNLFQVEQGAEREGRDTGCIINERLQNLCSVAFANGDYFKGIFKDGKPNGGGQMFYKASVKSSVTGVEFEPAQYFGHFRNGKREGHGKMVWADGSNFEGYWKDDERKEGTMVMAATGTVYRGKFVNDKPHDRDGMLLLPTMTIYQGQLSQAKTSPIALLMYPDGSIYYGQQSQFLRNGVGKMIEQNGGFFEGTWEADKLSGPACRVYDNQTNECFSGEVQDGKRNGAGVLYDPERDEVYDGRFEMNKRNGDGVIYLRNGHVLKGEFRNN